MKKILILALVTILAFGMLGCDQKPTIAESQADSQEQSQAVSESGEPAPSVWDLVFENGDDIFERADHVKQIASEADYSYDDMSKSYTLNIITVGTQADPFPENDAVKQWYKEKLNVEINLTAYLNPDEANQQIMLQYTSNTPPDLAMLSKNSSAIKLHKQGLIIEDWQKYIEKIPTFIAQAKDKNILSVMSNDKMFGLPAFNMSEGNTWQTWIRTDWLKALKMEMPKNTNDLLNAAKRFTEDDPDNNGQDDTWGYSSSGSGGTGSGAGFGWIEEDLDRVFNIPKLGYVDGQLYTHDINPAMKDMLSFMKTLSDNQWIDPDWYTQDWSKCYNKIRAGQVGIIDMWLPGAMTVMEGGAGQGTGVEPNKKANGQEWVFEDWALIETEGYKTSDAWDVTGKSWVAPASLAEDEGKLFRLLHFIDFNATPNEGGMNVGLACTPAGGTFIESGIGIRPDFSSIEPASLTNYRALANFNYPLTIVMENILPWYAGDDPVFQQKVIDLTAVCNELPVYEEYMTYVSVPEELVTIQSDLDKFQKQAAIDFVLGNRNLDDWEDYVEEYLTTMQGQKIIDSYAEQLADLGLDK